MRSSFRFALLIFSAITAQSAILFTDLTASVPNSANWVDDSFNSQSAAAPFTLAANDTVNQVQVKVENLQISTDTGNFDIVLCSNVPGSPAVPGSNIETLGTNITAPTSSFGIVSVTGLAPIALTSGTQYWIVLTGAAGTHNFGVWAGGGTPTVAGELSPTATGSGSWFQPGTAVSPQFEIDGSATPAPEPSTMLLFAPAWPA